MERVKRQNLARVRRQQPGEIIWQQMTDTQWQGNGVSSVVYIKQHDMTFDNLWVLHKADGKKLMVSPYLQTCMWAAEEGERRLLLGPVVRLAMCDVLQKYR